MREQWEEAAHSRLCSQWTVRNGQTEVLSSPPLYLSSSTYNIRQGYLGGLRTRQKATCVQLPHINRWSIGTRQSKRGLVLWTAVREEQLSEEDSLVLGILPSSVRRYNFSCAQKQHWWMQRRFRDWEHLLLLHRTWAQFPESTCSLQASISLIPGDLMPSPCLYKYQAIHVTNIHTCM